MKQFIKKIFVFLLGFIIVLYLLQLFIALRINNKTTTGHDNLELTVNKDVDIVFIGSSRCRSHFDPVFFLNKFNKKSINLGIDGHTEIPMAYNRLKDYLDNNISPKFVILSFDPFVRGGDFHIPTGNKFNKNSFARYSFKLFNRNWETVNHFGFDNYEKLIPLYAIFKYKQINNILFMKSEKRSIFIKYGYNRSSHQLDTIKSPFNDKLKNKYFNDTQLKSVRKTLKELNEYLKKKDIILICIQTPVFTPIYSKVKFNQTQELCNELNIPFVDASIESIRNDIKCFNDLTHMNFYGVDKMNKYFSNNVLLNTILNN